MFVYEFHHACLHEMSAKRHLQFLVHIQITHPKDSYITMESAFIMYPFPKTLPIMNTRKEVTVWLQWRHQNFLRGGHEEPAVETLRGSCHICKGPFQHCCELPVRLPCGHIFGHACLANWVRSDKGLRPCPLCFKTIACYQGNIINPDDGVYRSYL